ncbi:MAG: sigma 54-interacting transcriptional regulator [Terriglobales bacterium]
MALHPAEPKRHFPEKAPVEVVPIRRDLKENEDWYRDLVEHSAELLCAHDLEGRLLSVNPVPARLMGYSVEELLGKQMRDFVDPQFHAHFDAYLREIARAGEASGLMPAVTRSGEQRLWEYHSTLRIEGAAGPIVLGVAHDVTERLRAERALRSLHACNESLIRATDEPSLLNQICDLVTNVGGYRMAWVGYAERDERKTVCVAASSGFESGYLDALNLIWADEERGRGPTGTAIRTGKPNVCHDMTSDPRLVPWREDATKRGYRSSMALPLKSGEEVLGALTIYAAETGIFDTAEQLLLEELANNLSYGIVALRERAERKRAEEDWILTFDRVSDSVMLLDPDYRVRRANRATSEMFGVEPSQIIGRHCYEVVHGLNAPPEACPLQRMMKTGREERSDIEEARVGKCFDVTVMPTRDANGKLTGCIQTARDITERKQAEQALRASELRFRTVYERSPVGIVLVDTDTGRFLQANPKFCEIAGRSETELVGLDVASITHPDDIEHSNQYMRGLTERNLANCRLDKRYLRPDGSTRWATVLAVPMSGEGDTRRIQMALVHDITDQKREEEAIATLVQVRADSSESFFTSMAVDLAKCLDADYAFVGELVEDGGEKVRTLGACGQGGVVDNYIYDLAHTASETVLRQGTRSYVSGVAELFPENAWVRQMKMEGYAGTPLLDTQGRVIGVMAALYKRPLANAKSVESILQLFSTRTAAEIERKRTEEALRQSEERFRVALKSSPTSVFNQDRNLRYTWVYNPQLPLRVSEYLGKTSAEIFNAEDAARIAEVRHRVMETGVGVRHELPLMYGGRKRYFDTTIDPVFDAADAVIGITGATTEVTELRETTEALREAKRKLTEEKLYLEQEIDTEVGFDDIIGQSKALQDVMEQVGKVAGGDATVLLLGETGTGKELVARAVHRLSQRANNSFIKMNCAAIPSGLLESELFGNEKGAFTGAVSKKIGRLELADKGTLFLDEIGEISLPLQPKLLRVLQDHEFERLGGTHTLKVNFRLIAATNRDLVDAVREKEFRSDLYYRLNVFPIRVPPLRERRDDIRLLVEHFVQKFARRMNKSITSIPKKTMDALTAWDWPGNVRELENFVERSVILSHGSVLASPLCELQPMRAIAEQKSVDETLEATEREHILRALRESHGQIGGPRGAAMRLGLKRTTLQSKLKHLGINPRSGPTR